MIQFRETLFEAETLICFKNNFLLVNRFIWLNVAQQGILNVSNLTTWWKLMRMRASMVFTGAGTRDTSLLLYVVIYVQA